MDQTRVYLKPEVLLRIMDLYLEDNTPMHPDSYTIEHWMSMMFNARFYRDKDRSRYFLDFNDEKDVTAFLLKYG